MAKDSDFTWTASHTKAFECSKDAILSCATLTYYDDEKTYTIQVDASNVGLGVALIQEDKVRVSQPCFNLHPATLKQHRKGGLCTGEWC